MIVSNVSRSVVLADDVEMARSLWARARGLLGHAPLRRGQGMLITPCHSIHTFFMAFPIDAAFLDGQGCVVHVMHSMPPWRVSPHLFRAHSVLELPAGRLAETGTTVGDRLALQA
jgi:hypothetical protein